jgi:hypothetical protein
MFVVQSQIRVEGSELFVTRVVLAITEPDFRPRFQINPIIRFPEDLALKDHATLLLKTNGPDVICMKPSYLDLFIAGVDVNSKQIVIWFCFRPR